MSDINIEQSRKFQLTDLDDFTNKCVFLGKLSPIEKVKHGYNMQTTIYGRVKSKNLSIYPKIQITVTFIDSDNKKLLEGLFENRKRLLFTDDNIDELSGFLIIGESLSFEEKETINGEVFYTTSLELRT